MVLWDVLNASLPMWAVDRHTSYYSDGNTIFCKNEEHANALADLLEDAMPGFCAVTGRCDTDWWHVSLD